MVSCLLAYWGDLLECVTDDDDISLTCRARHVKCKVSWEVRGKHDTDT